MLMRLRLLAALTRAMFLHRLRERQTALGLLLLPLFLFLGIGAYKMFALGEVDLLGGLAGSSYRVVVVDPGGPFPGLGIDAAEAAARLARHPALAVTVAGEDPGAAPLHDRALDLVVAVRDGRVHVASSTGLLRLADLARDLLTYPAPAADGPPPGARFDLRLAPAEVKSGSGLMLMLPFYTVMVLASACIATGAAGFVADLRKGMLRHFLVSPVGHGLMVVANALSVAGLALIQGYILLGILLIYGEVPRLDGTGFLLAMLATVLLLTSIGFAVQSIKPADNPKGGGPALIVIMLLAMVAFQMMALREPGPGIDWGLLINPLGAVMDMIAHALTGGSSANPLWLSATAALGWAVLVAGVAALRFRLALEPDWSRR